MINFTKFIYLKADSLHASSFKDDSMPSMH